MTQQQPHNREYFENLKLPKDPLTSEKIDGLSPKEQLDALQARVAPSFRKTDHAKLKEIRDTSKHIARQLHKHIKSARDDMGIRGDTVIPFHDRERYEVEPILVDAIAEIEGNILDEDGYTEWLHDHVQDICNKCGLSFDIWHDYIVTYIALNKPPENAPLYRDELFYADAINDDWITLRINRRGVKLRDFAPLYRSIKAFLTPPDRVASTFSKKHLMRLDRKAGLTINAIAKLYYPDEYDRDSYYATDLVQKMLKNRKR